VGEPDRWTGPELERNQVLGWARARAKPSPTIDSDSMGDRRTIEDESRGQQRRIVEKYSTGDEV
jgi:hypothetical protein